MNSDDEYLETTVIVLPSQPVDDYRTVIVCDSCETLLYASHRALDAILEHEATVACVECLRAMIAHYASLN